MTRREEIVVIGGSAFAVAGAAGIAYLLLGANKPSSGSGSGGTSPGPGGSGAQEAYSGPPNPSPGYSGAITYADLWAQAQQQYPTGVSGTCGWYWIVLGYNGTGAQEIAEFHDTTLVRVYPQNTNNTNPAGTVAGGYPC